MSLSHVFKTNEWLLKQALRRNNTALMGKLMQKKAGFDFGLARLTSENFVHMNAEMARFIATNYTQDVAHRWGSRDYKRSFFLMQHVCVAKNGRPDVFEAFIETSVPTDKQCGILIDYIEHEKDRLPLLDKILKDDISRLENPYVVARSFIDKDLIAELDMLVTTGLDVHRDNEALLRYAAEHEKTDFCRHLVTKHWADIDIAIITARTKAEQKIHDSLMALRTELKPDAPAVPTIEGLSKDVTSLRATVRDLQKPAWQMDKKSLPAPSRN